ncbi:MAG: hypothetical protein ABI772_03090 [Bacteroidota bacterium]
MLEKLKSTTSLLFKSLKVVHPFFLLLMMFTSSFNNISAQTAWPSESWTAAVNLTSVMSVSGLTELSGLYWNGTTNRLYVSHGDGRLRVLQLNTVTNTFSQIGNILVPAGPEGITQVNNSANEFYTIDEDNYQIRKFTNSVNYDTVTLSKSWNILAAPSTMLNTGNTGPEGIAFVPDSFLTASGFVSQVTGLPYTSVKGMGGLIFIAHQDQGYIWVFDVNPSVSNNFAYVGKYKTNKTESCDLSFDRSTGLLYILHNTGVNTLETTDLTSSIVSGSRKFTTRTEYVLSNPSGNINVEGFAIASKCSDSTHVSVWMCRDVESTESSTYKTDCIRWFNPFNAPGTCNPPAVNLTLKLYIQGYLAQSNKMNAVLYLNNKSADSTACDSITVRLYKAASPHQLAASFKVLLKTNGTTQFTCPSSLFNQSFYIAVKPRSALETWSKNPVTLSSAAILFDFIH